MWEQGPPDDLSVFLCNLVGSSDREIRHSWHDAGVKGLWEFRGSGKTQPEKNRQKDRKYFQAITFTYVI